MASANYPHLPPLTNVPPSVPPTPGVYSQVPGVPSLDQAIGMFEYARMVNPYRVAEHERAILAMGVDLLRR